MKNINAEGKAIINGIAEEIENGEFMMQLLNSEALNKSEIAKISHYIKTPL